MSKTKAERINELESMLDATQNGNRHLRERLQRRIVELEAQRDRLLRYARASEDWATASKNPHTKEDFFAARKALYDAGDLTEDAR